MDELFLEDAERSFFLSETSAETARGFALLRSRERLVPLGQLASRRWLLPLLHVEDFLIGVGLLLVVSLLVVMRHVLIHLLHIYM